MSEIERRNSEETARALKSNKQEIAGKNSDFRATKKSNRESIRNTSLGKTLNGFNLHYILVAAASVCAERQFVFFVAKCTRGFSVALAKYFFRRATIMKTGTLCVRV